MNKRYLLVTKDKYSLNTTYFYTFDEARIYSENLNYCKTTIINLENENIKWKGVE
ncbi:hypothetical protein [Spiroplasma endosymbiont of Phyllotreta cruciferae]|uniref:hypothetical protein n=1 Tax=Spiroplasma endosymbiont of Phyllotreta cruciferae TaxID=2886375 RepID=UPI0020A0DC23|nr:hypothetical protein [Spiroplasma endosymbiont of Phyllotreta cruciferae]